MSSVSLQVWPPSCSRASSCSQASSQSRNKSSSCRYVLRYAAPAGAGLLKAFVSSIHTDTKYLTFYVSRLPTRKLKIHRRAENLRAAAHNALGVGSNNTTVLKGRIIHACALREAERVGTKAVHTLWSLLLSVTSSVMRRVPVSRVVDRVAFLQAA
jgi:hypothetical protein